MTKPKSGRKIPQFSVEHHVPRVEHGTLLGTRQAAALFVNRDPDQVRRRCRAIACDAKRTRTGAALLLYDLDQVAASFAGVRRQARHAAALTAA